MANVGGQAVLEGVMMRAPGNWAVAVRTPTGEIAQVSRPIDSAMARHFVFRLPVVRGVMALGESLAIGFRALAISANYAAQQEGEDGEVETELSRGALIFAFAIAIGFAGTVFKVRPARLVLADRDADPPSAADRGHRVRADSVRGEAPGQHGPDDAPRAGTLAAAADDARADARPARSFDSRSARGARPRGGGHAGCSARRGHGLNVPWARCPTAG